MTKNTKKAVWASALSILMCLSLLIGTTFAWFTDTASTSVNKIQAGKLDVALEYATAWNADGSVSDWANAEGETLNFRTADNRAEILWEPGCTYELPALRVVNKGDLALKYKVIITGINGDAKLNEAIEWKCGNQTLASEYNGTLAAGVEGDAFVISGHMKEDAGNEYQGLSIDGISITVVATQDTVEYDSTDNQYDASAVLPVYAQAVGNLTVASGSVVNNATVAIEQTIGDSVMTVTYPGEVKLGTTSAIEGDKTTVKQELKYNGDKPSSAMSSVTIEGGKSVASYELTLPVADDNTKAVTVTIKYTKGLTGVQIYHNGVLLPANGESATYDAASGVITLVLKHASPIDILYDAVKVDSAVVTNQEELLAALSDENIVTIKLGADIDLVEAVAITHSLTIDFCGYKINAYGEVIDDEQLVFQIVNTASTSNKLVFKDSVGGGELISSYGGVKLCSSRAQFELNDVTIKCKKGYAVEIYSIGLVIRDDWSGVEKYEAINDACIVINSGKIITPIEGGSSNGAIHCGTQYGATGNENTVTINGGEIEIGDVFCGIYVGTHSSLTINGGMFNEKNPGTDHGFIFVADETAPVKVTGGTFNMDPSAYVDSDNYTVTDNGNGTWTVTAK